MRALALAAVLAVAGATAPGSASVPSAPAATRRATVTGDDAHALERARRAAHEVPFSGTVAVTWRDAAGTHRAELAVQAGGGAVLVDGPSDPVLEMPQRRLARGHDDDWALLWSPGFGRSPAVPALSENYAIVTLAESPPVAGRETRGLELADEDRPRARLYFDTETGLLLRREDFDQSHQPERTVEFQVLTLDQSTPAPTVPAKASAQLASLPPSDLEVPADRAPDVVGDGYARLGVYRRGAVVQVHYSDGLYELSIFDEPGRLDDDALPGPGRQVPVGDDEARLYAWPGGHVLVWQEGPVVRTVVSDAPSGEMVEAAESLPGSGWGGPSLLDKVKQAAAALVDPVE